jgi:hypothetical protein
LLTNAKRLSSVALFACAIATSGCREVPPAKETAFEQGTGARNEGLAGEWRWVSSTRANQVIRPVAKADSTVIEIGPWGAYREYSRGSTLRGHYRLAEGRMYQLQDTAFVVLLLDSSRFFTRSGPSSPAIAIRSLSRDSLALSGTGTDSSLYTFVRVERPR